MSNLFECFLDQFIFSGIRTAHKTAASLTKFGAWDDSHFFFRQEPFCEDLVTQPGIVDAGEGIKRTMWFKGWQSKLV